MIPLKIPEYWFKEIRKLFIMFLWGNKKTRIGLNKLTKHRNKGGLGIPEIFTYYLAFNGKYPTQWAYNERYEVGSWMWPEQQRQDSNKQISISSMWYCANQINIKSPVLSFSCEIAKIIQKKCVINGLALPSCPLWEKPLFTAGGKTLINKTGKVKMLQIWAKLSSRGE